MSEANKELIRRYQDAYNSNKLDVLDELLHPEWRTNAWPDGVPQSLESAKAFYQAVQEVFSDVEYTTEDLIAEGDRVVQRWTFRARHTGEFIGLPPSGKTITAAGISIFEVADGKIVRHWAFADDLGFFHQLGADVPAEWLAFGHRST